MLKERPDIGRHTVPYLGRYGDPQHGAGIILNQAYKQGVAFLGTRDEFVEGVGLGVSTRLVVGGQQPGKALGQLFGYFRVAGFGNPGLVLRLQPLRLTCGLNGNWCSCLSSIRQQKESDQCEPNRGLIMFVGSIAVLK